MVNIWHVMNHSPISNLSFASLFFLLVATDFKKQYDELRSKIPELSQASTNKEQKDQTANSQDAASSKDVKSPTTAAAPLSSSTSSTVADAPDVSTSKQSPEPKEKS